MIVIKYHWTHLYLYYADIFSPTLSVGNDGSNLLPFLHKQRRSTDRHPYELTHIQAILRLLIGANCFRILFLSRITDELRASK